MRMRDWSSDVCSSDLRQRRHDAYPDGAVSATQARSHLCYRLPELLGAECCLSDEQSAGRSWPRSRAAPLEQRYAKPSFQQLYPARDCRLRYVQCSRRTPKASMFRDDNCISQIPKVEGDIRHKLDRKSFGSGKSVSV